MGIRVKQSTKSHSRTKVVLTGKATRSDPFLRNSRSPASLLTMELFDSSVDLPRRTTQVIAKATGDGAGEVAQIAAVQVQSDANEACSNVRPTRVAEACAEVEELQKAEELLVATVPPSTHATDDGTAELDDAMDLMSPAAAPSNTPAFPRRQSGRLAGKHVRTKF